MESILENEIRNGNFSSSQMFRLMANGKGGKDSAPFLKYVDEKKRERKLGRSLKVEKSSRATLWGKFLEERVHNLLPLGYELQSDVTIQHPTIKEWVGSPDNINRKESVVADTKCLEPDAFSVYVDMLEIAKGLEGIDQTEYFRENDPEKFWQLISNAVLLDCKFIEAIVYMPYESELLEIRKSAEDYDNFDQYKFRFITEVGKSELAYLPDNSQYKNLNIFRFEAHESYKEVLTNQVLKAIELL